MIKLKPRPSPPQSLLSKEVQAILGRFADCINRGVRLKSTDFDAKYWGKSDVKEALYEMHSGKCCYCERKRDKNREPDVEHFRPKAAITEDKNHPGYWWLAYNWDNYFFSCKKCNEEHKKNQFPLIDGSPRACSPNDNLEDEQPFLINPEKENPEDFIGYEWHRAYRVLVKAIGLDDNEGRGDHTIRITGINSGTIPEERATIVGILESIVDTMKWALREDKQGTIERTALLIKKETSSEREFAGFRRAFFRGNGLGEYVATN